MQQYFVGDLTLHQKLVVGKQTMHQKTVIGKQTIPPALISITYFLGCKLDTPAKSPLT